MYKYMYIFICFCEYIDIRKCVHVFVCVCK